jgi:1-acyl-sn-glycerol-3-phosphate acyltransferase
MKKILGYILTPIYHLYFGLLLILFHPIQVGGHKLFGDAFRKGVVDVLNYLLIKGIYIVGGKTRFIGLEHLPKNRPLIIVANHQSMYDIPPVVWGFRKHYPRFISKLELGKNLPSISYNLKHGGSALIDRRNGSQSVKEIIKLGRTTEERKQAVCIFPEGTRSKNGRVKRFMESGIHTLLKTSPNALIIPFVIDGHSQLTKNGMFPLQFGLTITYTALPAIDPKDYSREQIVPYVEQQIKQALNQV